MKIFIRGFFLFILCGFLMHLNAVDKDNTVAQQQPYVPPASQNYNVPPPYYGTQAQYYYNQNNPYSNSSNTYPYGFYGGFYGSPPPPTPSQAFPDKAASDNLYRYIQNR